MFAHTVNSFVPDCFAELAGLPFEVRSDAGKPEPRATCVLSTAARPVRLRHSLVAQTHAFTPAVQRLADTAASFAAAISGRPVQFDVCVAWYFPTGLQCLRPCKITEHEADPKEPAAFLAIAAGAAGLARRLVADKADQDHRDYSLDHGTILVQWPDARSLYDLAVPSSKSAAARPTILLSFRRCPQLNPIAQLIAAPEIVLAPTDPLPDKPAAIHPIFIDDDPPAKPPAVKPLALRMPPKAPAKLKAPASQPVKLAPPAPVKQRPHAPPPKPQAPKRPAESDCDSASSCQRRTKARCTCMSGESCHKCIRRDDDDSASSAKRRKVAQCDCLSGETCLECADQQSSESSDDSDSSSSGCGCEPDCPCCPSGECQDCECDAHDDVQLCPCGNGKPHAITYCDCGAASSHICPCSHKDR